MKLAIQRSKVEIFLESISKNLVVPKNNNNNASPSQELISASYLSLYEIENDLSP